MSERLEPSNATEPVPRYTFHRDTVDTTLSGIANKPVISWKHVVTLSFLGGQEVVQTGSDWEYDRQTTSEPYKSNESLFGELSVTIEQNRPAWRDMLSGLVVEDQPPVLERQDSRFSDILDWLRKKRMYFRGSVDNISAPDFQGYIDLDPSLNLLPFHFSPAEILTTENPLNAAATVTDDPSHMRRVVPTWTLVMTEKAPRCYIRLRVHDSDRHTDNEIVEAATNSAAGNGTSFSDRIDKVNKGLMKAVRGSYDYYNPAIETVQEALDLMRTVEEDVKSSLESHSAS